VAPIFVIVRLSARFVGGRMAGQYVAPPALRTPGFARGLLSQGGLAVAIALNYSQVHPDLNSRLILTATLLSVLLFEMVASGEAGAFIAGLAGGHGSSAPTELESVEPST
jgi:hypothetical protein